MDFCSIFVVCMHVVVQSFTGVHAFVCISSYSLLCMCVCVCTIDRQTKVRVVRAFTFAIVVFFVL